MTDNVGIINAGQTRGGKSSAKRTSPRVALQIVPDLDIGGVEALVELLASNPPPSWKIHVFATRTGGEVEKRIRLSGGKIELRHFSSKIPSPSLIWELKRSIRKTCPDIVHCRCVEANFHGLIATRLAGAIPCIVEEVGLSSGIRSPLARFVLRHVYRLADLILGQSRAVVRDLRQAGIRNPPPKVLYNPVAPAFLRQQPPRARKPYKFLAVGRLVPEKDFATLVRAFALARRKCPGIELQIKGGGALRAELEAISRQSGCGKAVRFFGQVLHEPEMFFSGDIFVLSSIREGHPVALLEAMASGLPILATKVGGIPEIIRPRDGCGLLVAPSSPVELAEAMIKMALMNSTDLRKMGRKARRLVQQKFSLGVYQKRLANFYQALVSERDGKRAKIADRPRNNVAVLKAK